MSAPRQHPSSGNWFAKATASTPAMACNDSTSRRWSGIALAARQRWGGGTAGEPGVLVTNVKTLSALSPADVRDRFLRWLMRVALTTSRAQGERDFADD